LLTFVKFKNCDDSLCCCEKGADNWLGPIEHRHHKSDRKMAEKIHFPDMTSTTRPFPGEKYPICLIFRP